MRYALNGNIVEMTPEEIAEMEKLVQQQAEYDKNRPPTTEEEIESLKQCILEMSTVVYK